MAGTIMPSPKFLGLDNNADPLSGGKLYTYAAGTTTPQDTYSDVGLTTPNPNPVILDSAGRATVFLSNSSYKFVLKDSDDVTIWSQDNITTFNPTNLDIEGTVGEAVSAGETVYLSDGSGGKTAGKWYKTDGDFDYASSLPQVAMVTVSASANASASLRLQGSYTFTSAIVAGQTYYLSATAGALATTPASYSRFFGVGAVDGFTVVFSPNPPNVALSPTFGTVTATQAFVLGSATTNGIRMDLSSGTMEIREGDDSAYGPLNTGALEAKGVLTVTAGTVSAPAITTTGDTNTGVYFPAADEVAVTVNGGEELRVTASGIKPGANDGGSLGVSGTAWADLFLASGGVVDWNAGDTTLTQSAGKLTIAGSGAGALDVKGSVSPTANDGGALGISGTAWADLFLASGGVINWNAGNTTLTQSAGKLTVGGSGAGDFGITGTALVGTSSAAMYESNAGADLAANYHLKYTGGGSVTTGGIAFTNTATTGMVGFWAENSSAKPIRGAAIEGSFTSTTAGAERSELVFYTQNLGTTAAKMKLTRAGELQPNANDGATLGASTVGWSDLYLASGGVIDWDSADVTITHSANTLAFAGASTAYTFADGPVRPASNDGAALGVSGTAWSDLFLASGGVINWNAGDVTITHATDKLTIAGGDVGIGISPSYRLDVESGANPTARIRTTNTGSYGILRISNSNTNGECSIGFRDDSDSDATSWVIGKSVNATDAFGWYYGAAMMTLTSGGDLLVGATANASGSPRVYVVAGATDGFWVKNTNNNSATGVFWNATAAGNSLFLAFGTETSSITQRGSVDFDRASGLTRYNTTSDYRAKDVYGPVTNAGAAIDAFKVYLGKMKGATMERPMMIAHEAQAVAPYAVTGEKDAVNEHGDPVYQQMDMSPLVPLLIAEVQNLRARVAALEA